MLKITSIQQFLDLPNGDREEILKAIKAKDRLDDFLRDLSKNPRKYEEEPKWVPCKCAEKGYAGWRYIEAHRRDDSDIHPSQIDKCLKLLVLSCSGYADQLERFLEPRIQQLLDLGSAWHLVMQRYGKLGAWGNPDTYHPEAAIDPDAVAMDGTPALPVANKYWIKCHADALLDEYVIHNVPSLGEVSIRLIHEYKTSNNARYSKLTRPLPEHKKQATIYSAVFDAPVVVYFYTNKDDNKMADFPVPFDHSIWADVVSKCIKVQKYTEAGVVPPWEETSAVLSPMDCLDCGFRKICQPPIKKR